MVLLKRFFLGDSLSGHMAIALGYIVLGSLLSPVAAQMSLVEGTVGYGPAMVPMLVLWLLGMVHGLLAALEG